MHGFSIYNRDNNSWNHFTCLLDSIEECEPCDAEWMINPISVLSYDRDDDDFASVSHYGDFNSVVELFASLKEYISCGPSTLPHFIAYPQNISPNVLCKLITYTTNCLTNGAN